MRRVKCLNCGNTEISENDNFCIVCGKKLKKNMCVLGKKTEQL